MKADTYQSITLDVRCSRGGAVIGEMFQNRRVSRKAQEDLLNNKIRYCNKNYFFSLHYINGQLLRCNYLKVQCT